MFKLFARLQLIIVKIDQIYKRYWKSKYYIYILLLLCIITYYLCLKTHMSIMVHSFTHKHTYACTHTCVHAHTHAHAHKNLKFQINFVKLFVKLCYIVRLEFELD